LCAHVATLDERFDLILSKDTMEHVKKVPAVLCALAAPQQFPGGAGQAGLQFIRLERKRGGGALLRAFDLLRRLRGRERLFTVGAYALVGRA
jgi:hypothetical protein